MKPPSHYPRYGAGGFLVSKGQAMRAWRVKPLPPNWRRLRAAILDRDGHQCRLGYDCCTGHATDVDHVVPACQGGGDEPSNLVAACRACHRSKTGREARGARAPVSRPAEAHPGLL